jgi:hypothetical protein
MRIAVVPPLAHSVAMLHRTTYRYERSSCILRIVSDYSWRPASRSDFLLPLASLVAVLGYKILPPLDPFETFDLI